LGWTGARSDEDEWDTVEPGEAQGGQPIEGGQTGRARTRHTRDDHQTGEGEPVTATEDCKNEMAGTRQRDTLRIWNVLCGNPSERSLCISEYICDKALIKEGTSSEHMYLSGSMRNLLFVSCLVLSRVALPVFVCSECIFGNVYV